MESIFSTFANNFIIGGFLIGTVSVITKFLNPYIGCWIYSLPLSYISIMLSVKPEVQKESLKGSLVACINTIGFFTGVYLSLYTWNTNCNKYHNFSPLVVCVIISTSIYVFLITIIKEHPENDTNGNNIQFPL